MSLCLKDLEGWEWETPGFDSKLVKTCIALGDKPLDDFEVEDYRILMGQNLGTVHLLPRVFNILLENPLAEGDYYPGDLLHNVLRLPRDFWLAHQSLHSRCLEVMKNVINHLEVLWETRRKEAKKTYGADLEGEAAAEGEEIALAALARKFLQENVS